MQEGVLRVQAGGSVRVVHVCLDEPEVSDGVEDSYFEAIGVELG